MTNLNRCDCSLGMWLDWQTQGTRVSRDLFYRNSRDIYIEVSHGPFVVDNNIFASEFAIENEAQGGAYINNLVCGKMKHQKVLNRSTPYHVPHSTKVAGFSVILGGDAHFDGYTTSFEQFLEEIYSNSDDLEIIPKAEQPVYINHNMYLNGAVPLNKEENKLVHEDFDPEISIEEVEGEVYLNINIPHDFHSLKGSLQSTETLGKVRLVNADFESPDGSRLVLDQDFFGSERISNNVGPFPNLAKGKNRIKVWTKKQL